MLTIRTKLGPSPVNGIGLFADQFIGQGTVIHRFVDGFDRAFTEEEFLALPAVTREYIQHYGYISKKNGCWIINFDDIKFTNHSVSPTMEPDFTNPDFEPPVVAIRDIEPGEELLEDYRAFAANAEGHIK